MNKKKVFVIILLVISILLIAFGVFLSLNKTTIKAEDKEKVEKVLKQVEKDFGKSGYTIKLQKVDGSNYVFYQKNDSTKELAMVITYNVDNDNISVEDKETISDINVEE